MAWDLLRKDFAQEPIKLEGAEEVAERLNGAQFPADAVVPGNSYAVGGRYSEGVVARIREDMARRFPDAKLPRLEEPQDGVLTFAYFQSKVRFPIPFHNHPTGMEFQDSQGRVFRAAAFGPQAAPYPFVKRDKDVPLDENQRKELRDKIETLSKLRTQIEILYVKLSPEEKALTFAIDLCKDSTPDQVILARLERKGTLGETVADLEKNITLNKPAPEYRGLIRGDQLWVPELALDLDHRFQELEGPERRFGNERLRGLFLHTAAQTIRFQLDATGAEVASSGMVGARKGRTAQQYQFNRPFLLYMKKRGAKQPFLVLWVDNSGWMLPPKVKPPTEEE